MVRPCPFERPLESLAETDLSEELAQGGGKLVRVRMIAVVEDLSVGGRERAEGQTIGRN